MANSVYIATSLDGFIADRNGGLNWLTEFPNPDQDDFGYAGFVAGIDALVMGRKTLETVMSFGAWPYEKKVFVLSASLHSLPPGMEEKAEIVSGDLHRLTEQLNQRGFRNLYIDGGVVIQSFLAEDLIDEIIISRIPILLGDGIPLFGPLREPLNFQHKKTEEFGNGIVKSHYTRLRR